MRTPRMSRLAAGVVVIGLVVASCGGDDDEDGAAGAPTSAVASSAGTSGDSSAPEDITGDASVPEQTSDDTSSDVTSSGAPAVTARGGEGIYETGFGQGYEAGEAVDGGTLRIATITGFETLDFSRSITPSALLLARAVMEQLMQYDEEGNVVPVLADSLESTDGVTWTMTLKPGITFSDGTPLDADAVIEHLQRLGVEGSTAPSRSDIGRISEMVAVDDTTIEFTLAGPWAAFPQLFTVEAGMIPSPTAVAASGDDWGFKPVGAGPFMVDSFEPGVRAVLVKNPEYRDAAKPHLDRVEVTPALDSQARFAAMQAGDFDVSLSQSDADFERARDAGLTVLVQNGFTNTNVVWNMSKAPFDDVRFREAVIRAVDIETINEVVFGTQRPIMRGMFASTHPYFVDTDWPSFDQDAARALVEEYVADGGDPTFDITVWGAPEYERVAAVMQQMLAEVGITMNTETGDQATMITEAFDGSYTAQLRYTAVGLGPDQALGQQLRTGNRSNISFVSDPEMDELIDEMDTTLELDDRIPIYTGIQERIRATLPMMPLFIQTSAFLVSDRVASFPPSPGVESFDINQVWLTEGEAG